MTVLGVGIIGAGPATQAIHLPTLARMGDRFRVVHVMDVNASVAESVGKRARANWSTSVEDVMRDAAVDVVAICSPPQFHAAQVKLAIEWGKRGILCEKPFAVTHGEANELAHVAIDAGIPLLVAAMHTFDPAWIAARPYWGDLETSAHTIRSSIVIPANDRFEDLSTEIYARPTPPPPPPADVEEAAMRRKLYQDGVMGLAIHDLPLVRSFAPSIDTVITAEPLQPFGYAISARSGRVNIELFSHIHQHWATDWTLDVWSATTHLHADFPPSYVNAGSAQVTVTDERGEHRFGPYLVNGYENEWARLATLVENGGQDAGALQTMIDDLTYALDLADAFHDDVVDEVIR